MTVARAFPNIALVKYWGKRDEALMLPAAGSLSLTLDAFATTTSVTVRDDLVADTFVLNGTPQGGDSLGRVTRFLDLVRELAGSTQHAEVISRNEAPTGAGLASSASGFAALAVAAAAAFGLDLDRPALSRLARRGSGSASRSLVSRTAMRATALTSPGYPAWVESTEQSLGAMLDACAEHDFSSIGRITETHAMRMHAVIQASDPPIRYLSPVSIAIFDAVAALRVAGVEAYATADAGPNVAVIAKPGDAQAVADALAQYGAVRVVGAGEGARVLGDEDAAAFLAAETAGIHAGGFEATGPRAAEDAA